MAASIALVLHLRLRNNFPFYSSDFEVSSFKFQNQFTFLLKFRYFIVCVLYILLKFHTNYRIYICAETVNDLISTYSPVVAGRQDQARGGKMNCRLVASAGMWTLRTLAVWTLWTLRTLGRGSGSSSSGHSDPVTFTGYQDPGHHLYTVNCQISAA